MYKLLRLYSYTHNLLDVCCELANCSGFVLEENVPQLVSFANSDFYWLSRAKLGLSLTYYSIAQAIS